MSRRILVTGPNGFIGRHVVSAALAETDSHIRLVRYHSAPDPTDPERVQVVRADLSDPASVHGLCRNVDAVVHCASRVDGDEQALYQANDLGTSALVTDAQRHGVRRFVYVSTAAVYGRGPFRQAAAHTLPLRPASATSRSRAAAERHVLAAGGTVLRPHLVYGAGDRWVIPGLAALVQHLGAPVACSSEHSAVEVGALAKVALASALSELDMAGVHHVNHPVPVRSSDLMSLVQEHLEPPAARALTPQEALERVAGVPFARHHLEMLVTDHWFLSDRIWRRLHCDPGPEPAQGLRQFMPWYRQVLG